MNILHISDLHFGTENDANNWYTQLVYDITYELDCLNLDLILVSGDITNKASPEEYKAATLFFEKLIGKYELKSDRIVIVPGNHDVDWTISEKSYKPYRKIGYQGNMSENNIIDGGNYIEEKDPKIYKERFLNFSNFYNSIKGASYPLDYEKQWIIVDYQDLNLLILGLNSAWNLDHYYKSRASINTEALSDALEHILEHRAVYDNRIKIAIWHHPLHSSEDDRIRDMGFLQRLAVAEFKVAFHGHIHKSENDIFRYDKNANGRNLEIVSAGTFGALTREWVPGYPLQYNFIKLNENGLIVNTRARREVNGAWKPEAIWLQGPGSNPSSQYEIKFHYTSKILPDNSISPSVDERINNLVETELLKGKNSFLPPNLPISLIDRTNEKQDIMNSLRGTASLIAIIGPGGLGKTALAIDIIYRCIAEKLFDNIIYTTAKEHEYVIAPGKAFIERKDTSITQFDDILNEIGRQTNNHVADLPRQPKLEKILSILSYKNCLVVIDNYESIQDKTIAEKFFRHQIPHKSKFLITSRHHINTGNVISLRGMTPEDGSEFLKSYALNFKVKNPIFDDPIALSRITKWSGGIPLVMKFIVGQMDKNFDSRALDELLTKDLEDEELLWFCFEGVYNHLSLMEKYVVQALAMLPGAVSRNALTAITGLVSGFIDEAIENLYYKSLVDYIYSENETRYSILPITRSYVNQKKFPNISEFWKKTIVFYCEITDQYQKNYKYLEKEFDNILFIFNWCINAKRSNDIVQIFKNMSQYFEIRGMNSNERLQYAQIASEAAYAIGKESEGDWIKAFDIAWIYQRRGKRDQTKAKKIYQSLLDKLKGNDDDISLRTIGVCYRNLALIKANEVKEERLKTNRDISEFQDDRNQVLEMTYKSQEYFLRVGYDDGIQVAKGLIGGILRGNKKYSEAIEEFTQALALANKHDDKAKAAEWLCLISRVYISMTEYGKAIKHIDQAMEMYLDAKWLSGVSYALHYKGTISYKIGNFEQAKDYFNEAAKIEAELGSIRHYNQLMSDLEVVTRRLKGEIGGSITLE